MTHRHLTVYDIRSQNLNIYLTDFGNYFLSVFVETSIDHNEIDLGFNLCFEHCVICPMFKIGSEIFVARTGFCLVISRPKTRSTCKWQIYSEK